MYTPARLREEHGGLPCRVASTHHDDLLIGAQLRPIGVAA
jgi:hypothetical protein